MEQKKGTAGTRKVANTCTATEGGLPERAEGRNYSQPEFEVKLLVWAPGCVLDCQNTPGLAHDHRTREGTSTKAGKSVQEWHVVSTYTKRICSMMRKLLRYSFD